MCSAFKNRAQHRPRGNTTCAWHLQVVVADVLCLHPGLVKVGLERCKDFPLGLAHLLGTSAVHVYIDSSFAVLREMVQCVPCWRCCVAVCTCPATGPAHLGDPLYCRPCTVSDAGWTAQNGWRLGCAQRLSRGSWWCWTHQPCSWQSQPSSHGRVLRCPVASVCAHIMSPSATAF